MWKIFSGKAPRSHFIQVNGGQKFEISGEETVLEATLRAGLPIPHSCRVGACKTCLCKVVKGKVRSLIDRSYVLSDDELQQNSYLACQTLACGDVEVEWAISPQVCSFDAQVLRRSELALRIWRILIEVNGVLEMRSGQYVLLKWNGHHSSWVRPYSVVRSQVCSNRTLVEIDVARQISGIASVWLTTDDCKDGKLLMEGPHGDSYADDSDRPLVALGAGSGIGAAYGVTVETANRQPVRSTALLIFGRRPSDIYGLEVDQVTAQCARYVYAWTEEPPPTDSRCKQGRVTEGLNERLNFIAEQGVGVCSQITDWEYRLFGSQRFISATLEQLRLIGIHPNRIRFDLYTAQAPDF